MPLTDFIERNQGRTAPPPTSAGSGSLADFINKKGGGFSTTTSSVPRNVDEARQIQEEDPTVWQRVSKQLMKPVGLVATLAEQTGKAIGSAAVGDVAYAGRELRKTPSMLGGIITGTRSRSFTDVFLENWKSAGFDLDEKKDDGSFSTGEAFVNELIPRLLGVTTDIAADPLNFVGGGLTKVGKVADKATELIKAGEVIAKDSKLYNQAKALGLTDDMLKLAPTKAEQVRNGQRALLTLFGNTRWEKTIAGGAPIYEEVGKISEGVAQTKVASMLHNVFSTKTHDEAFNTVKTHFDNLMEYRKGQVMEDAIKIQNDIGALSKDEALRVIDVIESGKSTGVQAIDDIAFRLRDNFNTIKKTEEGLGLLKTDIQDYFPHIKVGERGKEMTSWEKVKSLFMKADGASTEDVKRAFGDVKIYSTKLGSSKARKIEGTIREINESFGTEFFETRPAIAYAQRAMASAKAVTSKEFFESVKQFGAKLDDMTEAAASFVPSKVPGMEGLKFHPEIVRSLEAYQKAIKPEELNKALRAFDSIQNWWKAQALVAPSYHTRNFIGNMWNNFLGGVVDPRVYVEAGQLQHGKQISFLDDAGRRWDNATLMKAAKEAGVINEGWYAKDIEMALGSELGGASWNPMKQNFGLFKANRAVGTVLENNARLAHFIQRLKEGNTIDNAAASVKKYLFDYGDLTAFEKQGLKRAIPFYTWTRKNIPLQLEKLIKQPAKFAAVSKVTNTIEGSVDKPNEKYLGDYIKNNVGIRVGTDKEGSTLYFLLGSWLPAAQAIDFLSQPTENFIMSVSPFIKTPIELWSNQSSFFEDTFGQPSKIERYPEENQSWLGFTMRKKTAYILKNIRILNELDKLNPGSIFGDKENPSLVNRIAPEMGFRLPGGIGTVTTSEKRGGRFTPEGTTTDRILQSMFGKTSIYNPSYAKKFYLWDTQTKVRELERAIKDAQRDGQKEYAKRMRVELQKIKKERSK